MSGAVVSSGKNSIKIEVSAKLTAALLTPCSVFTKDSVLAAHEAQVIPVTGYVFIKFFADIQTH